MGNDFMRMINPDGTWVNGNNVVKPQRTDSEKIDDYENLSIKDKVQKIYSDFVTLRQSIDEKHEWDSLSKVVNNITNILNFVVDIWGIIQALGFDVDEVMTDPAKRKQFGKVMDDMIVLNGVAEVVDGIIINTILDHAAKVYVSKFRDKLEKVFSK